MTLELDMIQTLALATLIYYVGKWIKSKVTILEKFAYLHR